MTQRFLSFIVVLLLMFSETLSGQSYQNSSIPAKTTYSTVNKYFTNNYILKSHTTAGYKNVERFQGIISLNNFSADYMNKLGFFCQKELELEKITTLPFRFRLGSLEYVNYLEQKPNALKPMQ